MRRLFVFLVVLALAAIGLWLADYPGVVTVSWGGAEYESSLMMAGLGGVLAVVIALGLIWTFVRFVFKLPLIIALASHMRR